LTKVRYFDGKRFNLDLRGLLQGRRNFGGHVFYAFSSAAAAALWREHCSLSVGIDDDGVYDD
jgi:hypothetical protein